MYSLYDLYTDIMAGRRSDFTYNGIEFTVYIPHSRNEVMITYYNPETKERWRAFTMRRQVNCGSDLQGYAACLLHYKKDIWFDRHGELCSKEQFSPLVTKEQSEEDELEKLINNVMDIDTDDNFHPIF
jgi:mannitol/fructose-specific phosphotransferase system IIA component (Ntr-type)